MNETNPVTAAADRRQNAPLLQKIYALTDRMLKLNAGAESLKGKLPETILFLVWTVLHFVVSAFHERWFDEAVAWQIAKNAPWKEILFTVPHYEGHPQLWHLLLAPFAKAGAPFSLTLAIVSYVFMGAAVLLLLFRVPLPRLMRWLLPFSYFILFEYGVVSRPYCITVFSLILLGILHKSRSKNPLPYILTMLLLCLSTAYGIVIAGSVCAVWIFEIIFEKKKNDSLPALLTDKRILLLGVLLIYAVVQILCILPRSDTFALSYINTESSILIRLLYTFFVLPTDALISNVFFFDTVLKITHFDFSSFCICICMGLLLLLLLIRFGIRRKTQWYFIVPHCIFAVFSALVYFGQHHIGIWFAFLLFWLIITFSAKTRPDTDGTDSSDAAKIIRSAGICFTACALAVICIQGTAACINDLRMNFSIGKAETAFISAHGLEQYHVFTEWTVQYDDIFQSADKTNPSEAQKSTTNRKVICTLPESLSYSDIINAYLGHNIFYHYHGGTDDHAFFSHKLPSDSETKAMLAEIGKMPVPDVIIGSNNDNEIKNDYLYPTWGEEALEGIEYVRVFADKSQRAWKTGTSKTEYISIYVRREIAEKLGLEIIPNSDLPI